MGYRVNFAIPIKLHNLPISLGLFQNGCVTLTRNVNFTAMFDHPEEGPQAVILSDKLVVSGQEFVYNRLYELKHEPVLKAWLVSLNLVSPF